MIKRISIEIDVPEYSWVDVPTAYGTPIGEFEHIEEVNSVQNLIEYLQRHEDRFSIIEMEHSLRHALCRELIRERLRFIKEENIYWYGDALSKFLAAFDERSGLNFNEYKFDKKVISSGKKIQFKTFSRLFSTEDEAIKHIANIYTHGNKFEFKIVE